MPLWRKRLCRFSGCKLFLWILENLPSCSVYSVNQCQHIYLIKQFKLSLSESKSFVRLQAFKPTQVLPWTSNIGEGWSFQHLPHREFLLLVLNWVFIPYGRAELKCFNMQLYCSLVLPIRLLSRCWHSRSIIFFLSESLWIIWCNLDEREFSTTWLKDYIPWRREWRKQV